MNEVNPGNLDYPSDFCKDLHRLLKNSKKGAPAQMTHLEAIEDELGAELPKDYVWFASTFGAGTLEIAESPVRISIINYGEAGSISRLRSELLLLRDIKLAVPDLSMPVFPLRPGLLTWGAGDQGMSYCWLVKEDGLAPWSVVYLEYTETEVHCGFCEFLLGVIEKRIILFPNNDLDWDTSRDVAFVPEC
jgi:hypothetical protein